ncbi:MAG: hypothetical protein WC058_10940, partial [Phycisphaeraceae bacterium]
TGSKSLDFASKTAVRRANVRPFFDKHSFLAQKRRSPVNGYVKTNLTRTADFPGQFVLGVDPNKNAISIGMRTKKSRVLLPGDIPGNMLAELVNTRFFKGGSYRLYKVTHHCSATGDNSDLFSRFCPNDAATSCGASNRFGHPCNPPESTINNLVASATPRGTHEITCRANRDLTYQLQ